MTRYRLLDALQHLGCATLGDAFERFAQILIEDRLRLRDRRSTVNLRRGDGREREQAIAHHPEASADHRIHDTALEELALPLKPRRPRGQGALFGQSRPRIVPGLGPAAGAALPLGLDEPANRFDAIEVVAQL